MSELQVLSPPANQGNKQDGVWIEMKSWKRLRRIAGSHDLLVRRAHMSGFLFGAAAGLMISAFLHSIGAGQ